MSCCTALQPTYASLSLPHEPCPLVILAPNLYPSLLLLYKLAAQYQLPLMSRARMGAKHHPPPSPTDVILPMQDPYMTQIIDGEKNYEFRKYRLQPTVQRIWFYRTAPHSSITHVCETQPARTRNSGDPPLEENGLGNAEFNSRHGDWEGYDFAYRMVTVWKLGRPITLQEMRELHGFRVAPRGMVYLPRSIYDGVDLEEQKLLLDRRNEALQKPQT